MARATAPSVEALIGRPSRVEQRRILRRLARSPEHAARALLGHAVVRRTGRATLVLRIVETEAYLADRDPAAHSFRGRTARTEPLWGPPGTLYVYLVYGLHHCVNIAVRPEGVPGCVLLRAAEPLTPGLDRRIASGPGRLARALGLDRRHSGLHLFDDDSRVWLREARRPRRIGVSRRIGITKARSLPLRFTDAASDSVSVGGALARRHTG